MGVSVITRGERELSLRFDTFPTRTHKRLEERITALTDVLYARVEVATPVRTGRLRSEERERIFGDEPTRVAGYVSVYAPGIKDEYEKAGALEYGWWVRRNPVTGLVQRILGSNRRLKARMAGSHHINAFRYLRGPLDEMRPEVEAALAEATAEVVAEDEAI